MGPRVRGDEAAHREPTAVGLAKVHPNVREAGRRARSNELKLRVRTPLAPCASAPGDLVGPIGRAWPTCRARRAGGLYGR